MDRRKRQREGGSVRMKGERNERERRERWAGGRQE